MNAAGAVRFIGAGCIVCPCAWVSFAFKETCKHFFSFKTVVKSTNPNKRARQAALWVGLPAEPHQHEENLCQRKRKLFWGQK